MFFILNLHCNYGIFLSESEVATMDRKNTSMRLKEIMAERNLKQVDIIKLAQPYSEKYNIKLNKSDISQYISGKSEPGQDKLFILGMALNVNESWLMGFEVPKERYSVQKSSFIEQQKHKETAMNISNIFAGSSPLHLDDLTKKAFINFYNSVASDESKRSRKLLNYLPKLSTLTDEQQNIIYGMIDNMTPPQHNNIDNTLLAAHEDNNASEDDKKADIKLLKDYKSNKKDN